MKIAYCALALFVIGCSDQSNPSHQKQEYQMKVKKYSEIHSGYKGNIDGMKKFLSCWKNEINNFPHKNLSEKPLYNKNTFIRSDLPASYRHFVEASMEIEFEPLSHRMLTLNSEDAIYSANPVLFIEQDKEGFEDLFLKEYADLGYTENDPPDHVYYQYNSEQARNLVFRIKKLKTALMIKYIFTGRESWIMFPDEVSLDNEWEAGSLNRVSDFRYKSFAHLLASVYLEEHEFMQGKDPSLGHLYYYQKNIFDTCVKYLIDN